MDRKIRRMLRHWVERLFGGKKYKAAFAACMNWACEMSDVEPTKKQRRIVNRYNDLMYPLGDPLPDGTRFPRSARW